MLARRLQFDGGAHDTFHPMQFGGVAQRSTEDAGIYLTHLVCAGWAKGLQTGVVAFDIAQFFPLLNHEVLLQVIDRSEFPPCVGNFFRSYLVGRRTTYKWNAFTSGSYAADVGVGQSSALSPVLSALYLAPVIKLFVAHIVARKTDLMSYVDDGLLITCARWLEDNLQPLREAYGWMHQAFEAIGLVLEHSKSEAFHFSRVRANLALPIDLGFAPHTGDSPLRPKDTWRYLGFFFDRKLSFREHIRFYSTKALTTVNAMGMLGNSVRGLTPMQKRLLYPSCVVPMMTYGLRLWYFKGARVQGSIKALSQVQARAVRWITGCFHTTPGGMESLGGLLLLCRLSERGALRVALLADSHPLRTILGERSLGSAPPHGLGLDPGSALSELDLLGPSRDSARAAATIRHDEYEVFGPESSPGNRIRDLYPDRIFTRCLPSKSDEDVVAYQADLKRESRHLPSGRVLLLRSNTSPFSWTSLQLCRRGASGWLCFRTPCLLWRPYWTPVLGQGRSSPSLHVPSPWEWGMHKKAHNAAASVKISVGARPRTSRDFCLAEVDILSLRNWHSRFLEPAYQGQNFLDLEGSKKNSSLLPSTL
jgi:Reverse transcriptase (RNA-dependent DNA polymerase)